MAYQVLARKYRPRKFDEVYAQDQIITVLKNAILLERIAHAYLFTGSRGVGKTSLARIFAKSLNCINGPTAHPCGVCSNCVEIAAGTSTDVIEIDGASNTGVDDIRDLQKELMYSTKSSKYRIFIIDEVHMLSKNAFNALLKTLEEPPEKVIFIFATTEPHKVLPTIISRCQRFDFKRIPIESIVACLKDICRQEGISIAEDALFIIAKKADGGMRDALSLMDQVISYGDPEITAESVLNIFGIVHTEVFTSMMSCILEKDAASIIRILHKTIEKGTDIQEFINGYLDFIRDLMLLKIGVSVPEIPNAMRAPLNVLKGQYSVDEMLYIMSYLVQAKQDIKNSTNPIIIAELLFVKLSKISEMKSMEDLISVINQGKIDCNPTITEQKKPIKVDLQQEKINAQAQLATEIAQTNDRLETLTLEILTKHWDRIKEKLQKEKPVIGQYITLDSVTGVKNNMIHFQLGSELQYKMLNDMKHEIANMLTHYFNRRISVDFRYIPSAEKEMIHKPTIQDIKKELPELARFIEITDSTITNM